MTKTLQKLSETFSPNKSEVFYSILYQEQEENLSKTRSNKLSLGCTSTTPDQDSLPTKQTNKQNSNLKKLLYKSQEKPSSYHST